MGKTGFVRLIKRQLAGNPVRTAGLVIIVGILCFVLFVGIFVISSLRNGLGCLDERMGADLMLVPLGEEVSTEGILVKGEPGYFYLDPEVVDEFFNSDIEGIEKTACQFFLTSADQGCCDEVVQFIGIDEADDFTVMPWIRESMRDRGDYLGDLSVVVGSDIDIPVEERIKFYGRLYNVSGQLEETGTGLDQTVFASTDTIRDLKQGAIEQGFTFLEGIEPGEDVSAILIKIKDGYTTEQVRHNIRVAVDGLKIVEAKSLAGSVENSLRGFVVLLYILLASIFVLSFIILATTFKMSVYERSSQYAFLRGAGATKGQILKLILEESAVISGGGALLGIAAAVLILFPFRTAISTAVSMPFLFPTPRYTVIITVFVAFIGMLLGPVSALVSAGRISGAPLYQSQRSM